jgi:hypothetical protein
MPVLSGGCDCDGPADGIETTPYVFTYGGPDVQALLIRRIQGA